MGIRTGSRSRKFALLETVKARIRNWLLRFLFTDTEDMDAEASRAMFCEFCGMSVEDMRIEESGIADPIHIERVVSCGLPASAASVTLTCDCGISYRWFNFYEPWKLKRND